MLGFVVVATSLAAAAGASLIERVHWSTRDPRFFPGSHGVILYPQMGDRIDLICPVMSSSPFSSSSSSSSQSSASLLRRQGPQWSDSAVADSGSGLGLGLGFGPSPDFGTGPGLGSDLGMGPGPFLGMDPAVASGPGPVSGPGLGVGSGPGLGTGPGLGFGPSPGMGVNLDLSTGPAQRSGGIPALASGPGPNWGHVPGPDLGLDLSLDLGVAAAGGGAAGGGFGPGSRPILGHGTGPSLDSGQGLGPGPAEFHRLYLVSRDSSVRCEAPPGARNSRLVLACDRPARALKYTLKVGKRGTGGGGARSLHCWMGRGKAFPLVRMKYGARCVRACCLCVSSAQVQRVSPNYRGLEFAPKREYHIISTSDGTWEGLSGRMGGACVTHGMRLVLRVGLDPRDEERARGIMGGAAWQDGKTTRHHGRAMTSDPTQGKSRDWNASDLRDVTSTAQVPHPAYPGPLLIGWLAAGSALVLLISLVGLSITWPHLRRNRAPQSTGRRQDSSSSNNRRRRARSGARTGGGGDDEDEAEEETEEDGGVRRGGSGGSGGGAGGVAVAPGGSPCGGVGAPCPHYGKVSGDYGLPLYIVPDLARQHAASVYYQV